MQEIFNYFKHDAEFVSIKEFTSGHINDTYLIYTKSKPYYILQRINHSVFKDIAALVSNKVKVSKHLNAKYKHENTKYQAIVFVPSSTDKYYYKDCQGNYWNLMVYIDGCKSFERVIDRQVALEAGKILGHFLNFMRDFKTSELTETIHRFHDMEFRFSEFYDAKSSASKERLKIAKSEMIYVEHKKKEMLILSNLKRENKIATRVTHNDTKISNVLFKNNEAICLIDLDTVMPGIIHYDFGDAIRTSCANADEDEKDLAKVTFNLDFFRCFTKGFLSSIGEVSKIEVENLALSVKTMTFIMGLRMLTDFLNEDVYYKTNYDLHNLDRAINQFKLIQDIDFHFEEMQQIVNEC